MIGLELGMSVGAIAAEERGREVSPYLE